MVDSSPSNLRVCRFSSPVWLYMVWSLPIHIRSNEGTSLKLFRLYRASRKTSQNGTTWCCRYIKHRLTRAHGKKIDWRNLLYTEFIGKQRATLP